MSRAKSELYTSLSVAKQILMGTRDWRGDGPPPEPVAMTPIPDSVQHIINPAYTIGLGALRECGVIEEGGETFPCPECRTIETCQRRGLQCPVCGGWYHVLGQHLRGCGFSANQVRDALEIPRGIPLLSKSVRTTRDSKSKRARPWLTEVVRVRARVAGRVAASKPEVRRRVSRSLRSTGIRNLQNTCAAQIRQRVASVQDRVGRIPYPSDILLTDRGLYHAMKHRFGSVTNALLHYGFKVDGRRRAGTYSRAEMITALEGFYLSHGRLPTANEVNRGNRPEGVPSYQAIKRAFGAETYSEAMQKASVAIRDRSDRTDQSERKEAA